MKVKISKWYSTKIGDRCKTNQNFSWENFSHILWNFNGNNFAIKSVRNALTVLMADLKFWHLVSHFIWTLVVSLAGPSDLSWGERPDGPFWLWLACKSPPLLPLCVFDNLSYWVWQIVNDNLTLSCLSSVSCILYQSNFYLSRLSSLLALAHLQVFDLFPLLPMLQQPAHSTSTPKRSVIQFCFHLSDER